MKLTKLQRYTAYCIILHEAETGNTGTSLMDCDYIGLCSIIGKNLDRSDFDESHDDIDYKRDLPELEPKETTKYYDGYMNCLYFNNWEERIAALKQCIAETAPK